MEVGDATESGDPALFEKLPISWTPKDRPPLRQIYRGLISFRRASAALRDAPVIWLRNSNESSLITFKRADSTSEFVVVINFSNRPVDGQIEVAHGKGFRPVEISGMPPVPQDDFPAVRVGAFEWRIYQRNVSPAERSAQMSEPGHIGSSH
jgi:hypothetical protein